MTSHLLARLWDYGWIHHDHVPLSKSASDAALIERYVASPAFRTSFLPTDDGSAAIHGPFRAEKITASDFISLQQADLTSYIASIQFADNPDNDTAERAKIHKYLEAAFQSDMRCYVLKFDETNRDLFHEWGFVIWIFREFLFIGPEQDSLERFIVGYD